MQAAIAALVASSPAALDTLNELAAALGNDANFAATVTNALALKAPLASPDLTGNPTAPTAAQFDNDTTLASTAFVQRALGGYGRMFSYGTAGQTIPATQANSHINLFGTCSSIALPLAGSVAAGSVIMIDGVSVSCTINRQGTNNIFLNGTNPSATSVGVNDGESIMFVSDGTESWFATGIATLKYAPASFGTSLDHNGYQKLPSGLIVQWCGGVSQAASGNQVVTFPIAFPTVALWCQVTNIYGFASQGGGYALITATQTTATVARNGVDNANGVAPQILAVGY